jgi:hypothetical protein
MKTSVWIYVTAIFVTALLCSACLWAAEDVALDVFHIPNFPRLTVWLFSIRAWLPILVIAWLPAAITITRDPNPDAGTIRNFGAFAALGIVTIAGVSALAALLPWMSLIPVLR